MIFFKLLLLQILSWKLSGLIISKSRIQFNFLKILPIHILIFHSGLMMIFPDRMPLFPEAELFFISFTLLQFGIRSHLQSSISISILKHLKKAEKPVTAADLENYLKDSYGVSHRLIEMRDFGLIEKNSSLHKLTPKGSRFIKTVRNAVRMWKPEQSDTITFKEKNREDSNN